MRTKKNPNGVFRLKRSGIFPTPPSFIHSSSLNWILHKTAEKTPDDLLKTNFLPIVIIPFVIILTIIFCISVNWRCCFNYYRRGASAGKPLNVFFHVRLFSFFLIVCSFLFCFSFFKSIINRDLLPHDFDNYF